MQPVTALLVYYIYYSPAINPTITKVIASWLIQF